MNASITFTAYPNGRNLSRVCLLALHYSNENLKEDFREIYDHVRQGVNTPGIQSFEGLDCVEYSKSLDGARVIVTDINTDFEEFKIVYSDGQELFF